MTKKCSRSDFWEEHGQEKCVVIPGLEPGTFSTSRRRDNRYTIRPHDYNLQLLNILTSQLTWINLQNTHHTKYMPLLLNYTTQSLNSSYTICPHKQSSTSLEKPHYLPIHTLQMTLGPCSRNHNMPTLNESTHFDWLICPNPDASRIGIVQCCPFQQQTTTTTNNNNRQQ